MSNDTIVVPPEVTSLVREALAHVRWAKDQLAVVKSQLALAEEKLGALTKGGA